VRAAAAAALVLAAVGGAGAARAEITPVLDAHVSTGVNAGSTVLGRLMAGGMLLFDDVRFAVDAHLSFEGFLRLRENEGVLARSFGLLNLGARYAFQDARFQGPYVAAGAGFGLFAGDPKERKVVDDESVCGTAPTSPSCTFGIERNINGRLGFGWGFGSGEHTTVGVRLDVMYWWFSLADNEDQLAGAPNVYEVPRPVDTFTVMLGLEFMRWP